MNIKRLFLVVMIVIIVTSAFAGGTKETAQKSTVSTGAKTPIEIYNPDFQFPTEQIELQYWEVFGERPGWLEWAEGVAEEYSQIHPNVSIRVRVVPVPQINTTFLSAAEAQTLPDVFALQLTNIHALGIAAPAPEWVERLIDEKYVDAAKAEMRYSGPRSEYDGQYLGWLVSELDAGQMLYYNKDMLAEAGVSVPTTSTELLNVMQKTTKYDAAGNITQGGFGVRYAGSPGGIAGKWLPILSLFRPIEDGYLFSSDWESVAEWEGEDFQKALQFYHDMVWEWKVSSVSFPAPAEAFKLGMVAMTNRESFLIGVLQEESPDLNFGVAPLVVGAGRFGQYPAGRTLATQLNTVSKDTPYPEVAWDFNMFMNNDVHDLELSKLTGSYPKRKANADSTYAKSIPWAEAFVGMSDRPVERQERIDPWGARGELNNIIGAVVESALINEDFDVVSELKAAKAKADAVLAEYKQKAQQ
ncbi:MAG: extracellular solute-binding protein [Bacteroidetes bacterium]|nr:extracellular solute-binding protein [Bacteroidota bacterium]